ncbi:Stk1 family PASTA domain-containing Ser/Thr kinase [Eggerthellaceae bacterium zg-1084]|uniref:Stk1 family PASTA domain-containing Ser/Thr kinase n=1 Tax=Berryella wangjianweii TaxID=2734634 RepID=UPI001556C16B|nr:Stk1 family PASTA domain-containing Ser/Thr kinase [Berryella wangjianweii]NPD30971.1 Stk1 family PASTA domain-containing Ser/Thr kinase [Berryella wangjianweii]NPD31836.1 Stk1 family PASTA domain-containing Ser/Thr kinase [Eggerthellaceae bacterium zg-997]
MTGSMTGRLLNNRYKISERVGVGGMAEVYRALDNVLGRAVAVKVMLPQYAENDDFTVRFRQEAAAAANLQSPYIVNVYDWGQDNGTYYIVMEFVRGSDLKNAINQRGAINQRKVAEIGSQVCQALSVAHGLDIIHRDIKPQNIMVQPDGNVKVMDFGIARAKNSTMSKTSAVLGTAHYISPEQAQGKELTPASDIYSLGVVLYESVTGKLPFDGEDAVSVAMKQVQEMPVPPSQVNPAIDADFEAIILKAMSKNPQERFATALEMRRALNDYLAGRTVNVGAFSPSAATAVIGPGRPAMGSGGGAYAPANSTSVMPKLAEESRVVNPETAANYRAPSTNAPRSKRPLVIGAAVVAVLLIVAGVAWALAQGARDGVNVPDVAGKTLEEATDAIQEAGLSVGSVTYAFDPNVESGKVTKQDPKGGSKAPLNSKVNLTLSEGAEQVEVPDLSNMTADEAQRALKAAGLKFTAGAAEHSSDVPQGKVARQSPEKGSQVPAGSNVTYYLSAGEETLKVPDVTGMSESQAKVTLENAGFKVEIEQAASSDVPKGSVIRQTPSAGSSVKSGTTVLITVSAGSESHTVKVSAGSGGTAWASSEMVSDGESVTVYYKADSGYMISQAVNTATGNKFQVSDNEEGSFTIPKVTSSMNISVTFVKKGGNAPSGNQGARGGNPPAAATAPGNGA